MIGNILLKLFILTIMSVNSCWTGIAQKFYDIATSNSAKVISGGVGYDIYTSAAPRKNCINDRNCMYAAAVAENDTHFISYFYDDTTNSTKSIFGWKTWLLAKKYNGTECKDKLKLADFKAFVGFNVDGNCSDPESHSKSTGLSEAPMSKNGCSTHSSYTKSFNGTEMLNVGANTYTRYENGGSFKSLDWRSQDGFFYTNVNATAFRKCGAFSD